MLEKIRNSRFLQYYAAVASTVAVSAATCHSSWPSPMLPLLTSEDSPIGETISREQGSWVSSVLMLSPIAGSFAMPWILNTLGRKNAVLVSFVFSFFPWIAIIFAKSVWVLYIARAFAGFSMPLSITNCAVYNGEIADPDIRGKLTSYVALMKIIGDLVVMTAGPLVSYVALAVICACISLLFLIMFFWVPESPHYLVEKGRLVEARKALVRFNAANADSSFIDKKLATIQVTQGDNNQKKTTFWELVSNKDYRRTVFIVWGVKTLATLCGQFVMNSYYQTIIKDTGSSISPEVSSILFGGVQIPASLLSLYLMDRVGRRPLLIISSTLSGLALIAEGTYFFLQDYLKHDIIESLNWLPTTAMLLYVIMKPIGLVSIHHVLVGEVFPSNIKGVAVSASVTYCSTLAFLTGKFFDPLSEVWGRYTMLWFFGGVCIWGACFVTAFLPETKGKKFEEIHELINSKKLK